MDLLELDVHLSKDGVVVISHDHDFMRLCGSPKLITETNFNDFPPMMRSI
jgi:glycerophosphoryl diester phosphodiesterase